jgi:pimeloyl-ACP methyl ester carboxylesterase
MFVPAYSLVGDAAAPKLMMLLHGALGSGNNLRSLGTKLVQRRPEYRAALVDLRHHGASLGAPRPSTLRDCAEDLERLAEALSAPPHAIAGHSFGGKVGLMFASIFPGVLRQLWVLDSNPGAQTPGDDHEVLRVLSAVRRTATPAPSRQSLIEELMREGISAGTAQWLATNLRREGDAYVWNLEPEAIHELMLDYFAVDLWPVLEQPSDQIDFRMVVAERSDRWAPGNRARLEQLTQRPAVKLHVVPEAGHWLHVDNPAFLLELMSKELY